MPPIAIDSFFLGGGKNKSVGLMYEIPSEYHQSSVCDV